MRLFLFLISANNLKAQIIDTLSFMTCNLLIIKSKPPTNKVGCINSSYVFLGNFLSFLFSKNKKNSAATKFRKTQAKKDRKQPH